MNKNLIDIAERRARLVALSETQRQTIRHSIEPWRQPLARVDQGLEALRYVRSHPTLLTGTGVLLLIFLPSLSSLWYSGRSTQYPIPPLRHRLLLSCPFVLRLVVLRLLRN